MINGIDVSSYQSSSYSTAGLSFVIVKATEGTSYRNPRRSAQVAHGREAGLHVGHYHYAHSGSVAAQTAFFLANCPDRAGDSYWIDWEESAVSNAAKDAMIKAVKKARPNARVGLYCNTNYWLNRDRTSYAGDALWIAHYGRSPGSPGVKAAWMIHQYTDNPIDKNVARFDSTAEMVAWAGGRNTEDSVALSSADVRKIATTDGAFTVSDRMRAGNPANTEWKLESILQYIADRVLEVQDEQRVQALRLSALESRLGSLEGAFEVLDPSVLIEQLRAELEAVDIQLSVEAPAPTE